MKLGRYFDDERKNARKTWSGLDWTGRAWLPMVGRVWGRAEWFADGSLSYRMPRE
jgi:hypothetical protein